MKVLPKSPVLRASLDQVYSRSARRPAGLSFKWVGLQRARSSSHGHPVYHAAVSLCERWCGGGAAETSGGREEKRRPEERRQEEVHLVRSRKSSPDAAGPSFLRFSLLPLFRLARRSVCLTDCLSLSAICHRTCGRQRPRPHARTKSPASFGLACSPCTRSTASIADDNTCTCLTNSAARAEAASPVS